MIKILAYLRSIKTIIMNDIVNQYLIGPDLACLQGSPLILLNCICLRVPRGLITPSTYLFIPPKNRIAVFSIEMLKDERIVVIAELRNGFPEEVAFSWMSQVLQAVDSIHQVSVYALALVPQNHLPRVSLCYLVRILLMDSPGIDPS